MITPVKSDVTFGNPNDPPQGAINAKNPRSITDPGPQNPAIRNQFPGAFSPPATDVGSMPLSWASFNNASRRIQNGSWARQVTQDSFALADTISGVNMRLTSGGIREMHWHQFAEWAYMTYGTCRITVLDELGRPYIADAKECDLWYFPAGLPHSLQGSARTAANSLYVSMTAKPPSSAPSCEDERQTAAINYFRYRVYSVTSQINIKNGDAKVRRLGNVRCIGDIACFSHDGMT